MNRRTRISIAAATAVAAAGTASAFLVPAASATAAAHHPATRTLTFTSVQHEATQFSRTTSAQADKDVNKAGKIIGFDVLRFSFNPKTNTVTMNVTVDLAGGMLYGQLRGNGSPVTRGLVTGGTGAFKGARGTIVAKTLNPNGAKTAVTITYHT